MRRRCSRKSMKKYFPDGTKRGRQKRGAAYERKQQKVYFGYEPEDIQDEIENRKGFIPRN